MTRRPASRRPPRLAGAEPRQAPASVVEPTPRQRLQRARVAGRHPRYGRDEVAALMRRVARGDERSLLGVPPVDGLELDDVAEAVHAQWGHSGAESVAAIDPDLTLSRALEARARIENVASLGGRVAFATTSPASLLPLYQALARFARAAGADVLGGVESGAFRADGRAGRRLWWLDGVAVVTDGASLLSVSGLGAADELFFLLPRPDLVVADRAFAGGALADEIETVALADLDAVALGVAAAHGRPVTLVPLADGRPATAYGVLCALAELEVTLIGHSSHDPPVNPARQLPLRGVRSAADGVRGEPRGAVLFEGAIPDGAGSRRADARVVDDGLPPDQGG